VTERGPRSRLVGFKVHGCVAPEPASLIRHRGRLAGRVTSCGYSPIAGATIGLAWVPADLAREGEPIQIDVAGVPVQAVVQLEAFYDPTGERLRS
jgi:glycine cleavage system aminomethyltransferase T